MKENSIMLIKKNALQKRGGRETWKISEDEAIGQ
jgi:hypothetical protein